MPDSSQAKPVAFNCEGGLVLNKSTFLMRPGEALELVNFEPDISGGYRRINGFEKFITPVVPYTSADSEKVSMVAFFNNKIMAARGEKIFTSAQTEVATKVSALLSMTGSGTITVDDTTGFSSSGTIYINSEIFTYTGKTSTTFTGVTRATSSTTAAEHLVNSNVSESWTAIDTGRTNADKYELERFNFDGTDKIILVDRTNAPVVFNESFSATDVSESSVGGAKHVVAYKGHMFYAGMSSTPQELVFSQPFDEDAFSSGSGAGSIKVDDNITGLKTFRDTMYIFCENRIFSLTGTSSANFAITPVTRDIGCINGDSIQEFAGDLIFLGPDGLRTVAGTARIGDVELGTISRNVQSIFDENISNSSLFDSIVIPDKTQYRIFFAKSETNEASTDGIICVKKGEGFEFSKLRGIKPASTDTFIKAGTVKVLHGSFDGYVHTQEKGNTFDGTTIFGKYRSPDLTFDDTGIRKHMQRVIVNYKPEAAIDADLFLRYDYEEADSARPAAYPLDSEDVVAIYGTSVYGTPTYGGVSQPLVRQPVEGSGFAVALRVNDGGVTAPYSLKGFQLEYHTGARR
jgi:hypothetical protein